MQDNNMPEEVIEAEYAEDVAVEAELFAHDAEWAADLVSLLAYEAIALREMLHVELGSSVWRAKLRTIVAQANALLKFSYPE
jgi:hypothetical protein